MSQNYYPSSINLPNSVSAVVSLVTGILGLTFLPIIGSIIALITGYMARKEIKASPDTIGGEGMAATGIILGWIGLVIAILAGCVISLLVLIPLILYSVSSGYNSTVLPLISFFL